MIEKGANINLVNESKQALLDILSKVLEKLNNIVSTMDKKQEKKLASLISSRSYYIQLFKWLRDNGARFAKEL